MECIENCALEIQKVTIKEKLKMEKYQKDQVGSLYARFCHSVFDQLVDISTRDQQQVKEVSFLKLVQGYTRVLHSSVNKRWNEQKIISLSLFYSSSCFLHILARAFHVPYFRFRQ